MPFVEINNFDALNDNKPFFDQSVRNKQEVYEKLVEISTNDDYYNRKIIRLFLSSKIL